MNPVIAPRMLLFLLILCLGCSNKETFTREEFTPSRRTEMEQKVDRLDVTVFVKDSAEYRFLKGNLRFQHDTLSGSGTQILDGRETPFRGEIPLASMTSIMTKEFSLAMTIFGVGLPVGLLVGLLWYVTTIRNNF